MSKIKTAKGSYIEDITGQTFNRLTVLELTDKKEIMQRALDTVKLQHQTLSRMITIKQEINHEIQMTK